MKTDLWKESSRRFNSRDYARSFRILQRAARVAAQFPDRQQLAAFQESAQAKFGQRERQRADRQHSPLSFAI